MVEIQRDSRLVIISGASSGIGLATARRFAQAGDTVVNLDLTAPAHEEAGITWMQGDVTDWLGIEDVINEAEARYGPLRVVVANAGISARRSMAEISEQSIRQIIDVNILGVLGLWKHAAKRMLPHGTGVLLATASTNGIVGYPYYAEYNASKAAVLSLCQTFALEFAPVLRTATVSPGYVMTPMQQAEYTEDMIRSVNTCIPVQRHALPEEIAEAFFFLASPAASFITGQTIVVDGGELAGGTASMRGLKEPMQQRSTNP